MLTAFGGYYLELKNKALADGVVTLADFGVAEEAAPRGSGRSIKAIADN